jgi:two-component system, NarL family, sensor histidine kinase NreB
MNMDLTLRTLLDIETDQIIWCDLLGNILFVNTSAALRLGKNENDLLNNSIWDIYPESYKFHHQILMNQAIKNCHLIKVKNKDHDAWLETTLFPICGVENKVESVVLITKEISSFVETEDRLKQVLLQLINAQEEERYRISRDLHDEIGQRMTSLVLQFRVIKDSIENGKQITIEEISNSLQDIETINKQIRQIFYQLYPPSLNRMALSKVLEAFCMTMGESNHFQVDFNCQVDLLDLKESQNLAIYRFYQEGFNNVIKHAVASAVWINIDYSDEQIYLSLEDNGVGFDQEKVEYGVGLHGITERFAVLNGKIKIESAPGKGTRLSGFLPVMTETEKVK